MAIKFFQRGDEPSKTTHEGLVLDRTSHYFGDGVSHYYAIVWNPAEGKSELVCYGSDMGYDAEVTIDAPVEIQAAHENNLWEARRAHLKLEAERLAKVPEKGKVLKVVRGRKVPLGTVGVCVWIGNNGYGMQVLLIDASGNKHSTSMNNVEVVVGATMTLPERKTVNVTVQGKIARTTERALLIKTEKGEFWFPKSQIKEVTNGFEMPDWLAKKNNLIIS